VHQDAKDPTKYVVDLGQSGLGLPDRDYYLKADDAKLKDALTKYQAHIEKMATIAGDKDAAKIAKDIVGLETALAKVQWTKVENRDPVKTYNVKKIADLGKLAPGYDWAAWVKAAGVDGKLDSVIVSQPSYLTGFAKLIASTPLPVWKEYFEWQLLHNAAPTLPKAYVDENFAFYGTTLRGIPENRPRWKRGVAAVESSIGEGVGKLYVAKYFPPENKARMEALVKNLLTAYSQSIDTLDWMGDDTKKKAHEKLAKFTPKIGYPNKWRDYSALEIKKDDLYGNLTRATVFEYNRNIDKLGKPIDRDEWGMTPQTVNAYYNPELNEIVFPAAILQPPFFNVAADDAVNYGGIGGVIGHEISHGFDDQGSQYDGDGKLLDAPGWFTAEDLANFKKKTAALVAQYNAFDVIPGYKINGELTLGENIADNSGLAIAYKAYKLSLAGKPSETIDGMTGEQRLYAGWAQVWRGKSRDPEAIRLVKVDPHSPANARGLLPLKNQPGFYEAYDVKEGDKMFLAPDQRVIMW
jgi:predicted metalloendopeptidase